MLEPIEKHSMEEARALLARGFPMRAPAFWASGLERLAAFHEAASLGPVGQIMRMKGEAVGVILTMRSRREGQEGAASRSVVNLSSWYVDERFRLLAPRMLQQVLAEPVDTFTDLTPSPPVTDMIGRFGFERRFDGGAILALPMLALRMGPGHVAPVETASVDAGTGRMVEDHLGLGCLACALVEGDTARPVVFAAGRRKGLPAARLVYADDLASVRRNLGEIARFLLARGVICLEMPANRSDVAPGTWFSGRSRPTFVRGLDATAAVDHAYSEFVFLRI
jgi:hypothetical protein